MAAAMKKQQQQPLRPSSKATSDGNRFQERPRLPLQRQYFPSWIRVCISPKNWNRVQGEERLEKWGQPIEFLTLSMAVFLVDSGLQWRIVGFLRRHWPDSQATNSCSHDDDISSRANVEIYRNFRPISLCDSTSPKAPSRSLISMLDNNNYLPCMEWQTLSTFFIRDHAE